VAAYVPTEREQAFRDTIENPKYERDTIKGFYSKDELAELLKLKDTERDVENRMPVKMTRHFYEMARNSKPLQTLVKANPDETLNLAGIVASVTAKN